VTQYAFGHALRIKSQGDLLYRFQNFFINQNATHAGASYDFVPFGFSGVTVNRTGDGLESSLVFPNNDLTRAWSVKSIQEYWIIEVDVLILDEGNVNGSHTLVHSYVGQVTGGQWDNVSLNLQLSSVLDAVGTDVPRRSLTRKLVGNLPLTSNVRLQ
jgi:hypothetical protein